MMSDYIMTSLWCCDMMMSLCYHHCVRMTSPIAAKCATHTSMSVSSEIAMEFTQTEREKLSQTVETFLNILNF